MNLKPLQSAALLSLIFLEGFKGGVVHAVPVPVIRIHSDDSPNESEPENPVVAEPSTNPSESETSSGAGSGENIQVDCSGYFNNSGDDCAQSVPVSCRTKVCAQ